MSCSGGMGWPVKKVNEVWPLGDALPRPRWTGGPLIVTFSPSPPQAVSQLSIVGAIKQGISRKTRNAWVTSPTS